MDVRLPDGTVISNVPDDITRAALTERLSRNGYDVSKLGGTTPAEPQAAESAGKAINSIPRQLGLTARYALEGPANATQLITEPVRNLITDPLTRLLGGKGGRPLGEVASSAADWLGLPKPETPNERVVGDAARLVAGSGATMGAGSLASALPGIAGRVGASVAAAPVQQLSGAAGAGLASGASREAGGGDLMQTAAGVAGGLAGALVPGVASAAGGVARRVLTPKMTDADLDVQISRLLTSGGDENAFADLSGNARRVLRNELRSALQAGKELDPAAVRRLADFRATGLTPTRGMVTLDPVQITREQNLAKVAANSSDSQLHGLPRLQNQNNTAMIRNMNDLGAGRADAFSTGERAIGSIRAQDDALAQNVNNLYGQARNMAGGDIPIERAPVINGVYDALARENKMAFLPDNIGKMLNDISAGTVTANGRQIDVPFNADTVDTLKTMIATAQRGTQDGNIKAALRIARQAIDSTPINPLKGEFGGGQVMPAAMGSRVAAQDAAPAEYMSALNDARAASASRFGWQESSRPVEAALSGAEPDKFFQRHVIAGSVQDAQNFMRYAGPEATRESVLGFIRDKALNGAADEVGKFSQSGFNKALRELGNRKLETIFEPEQLAQLRALGRASSYAQAQPVGSAVNNSNSGALLIGRGIDLLHKVPVIGPNVAPALQNIDVAVRQRAAQKVLPSLLAQQPGTAVSHGLLAPALAMTGGLLSSPVVP